ncbi:Nuclear factor interleukin-3-regulated protein [Holothuria leucospilota]|uniref:Nuclear factor interleukin-3-regulated protein n=1 Tax=Holothuria leucospilota TaxID=206669 RepID=A0A9Q1HCD0_HOLLE|nr:Nuclear factor interleukin-3-regulated protein [Holothuria leucospilota]
MAKFTFSEHFPAFKKPFNRQADLPVEAPASNVTMATTCVSSAMASNAKPIQLVHPAFLVAPTAYHSPPHRQDMEVEQSSLKLRPNCLTNEERPPQLPTKMVDPYIERNRNALAHMRKQREFVPDYQKDNSYWVKRQKNNEAAKRSREKRRLNDMALEAKVVELMKENSLLREELAALKKCFGLPQGPFRLPSLPQGPVKIKTEVTESAEGGEYEHSPYPIGSPKNTCMVDSTYESAYGYRREQQQPEHGTVPLLPSTAPSDVCQENTVNALSPILPRGFQEKEALSTISDKTTKASFKPFRTNNTSVESTYSNDNADSPSRKRSLAHVHTDVSGAVDLRLKVPDNETSQQNGDLPAIVDLKGHQYQHKLPLKVRSKKDGHSGRISDQGNRDTQENCPSGVPQNIHTNSQSLKCEGQSKPWCVETNDSSLSTAAENHVPSYGVHEINSTEIVQDEVVGAVRHHSAKFCRQTPYEREDTRSHWSQNSDLENENMDLREKLQSLTKDVAILKEIVASGVVTRR